MNKTNNNKIIFRLKILSVLIFILVFFPFNKVIAFSNNAPTYVSGHYNSDGSYTFGDFVWDDTPSIKNTTNETNNNPVPSIYSIENKIEGSKTSDKNTDSDSSNLAASAIFGSTGSFFPSGLIQWILFAIIILLIVILARRVFGATAKYNETPMKTP